MSLARHSGGSEIGYGDWNDRPRPGYESQEEVGFEDSIGFCTGHFLIEWLRFDENGRLQSWWPSEFDGAC
jgi:hypothetical protein